jgi:hypothetical protein
VAEVIRQRPMSIFHPYVVWVCVARDGSEACVSLNPPEAFCAQDGAVKETRLELAFSRYEVCKGEVREVRRPKGLLAYAASAGVYVRLGRCGFCFDGAE